MAVTDTEQIDFIGIDKLTNEVVLTISDHLNWDDELSHTYVLQQKINSYIAFIESGELCQTYLEAKNRSIVLTIAFQYNIPPLCTHFLNKVSAVLNDLDVKLLYTEPIG